MVEKLKESTPGDVTLEYAKLQSFFSFVQMIGSLFIGGLIDHVGVRAGFIITNLSSALSYLLLSQATSMDLLYYSKIPGMLQAG